jgi:uncharacterized iron-regulated membrane protein
MRRSLYRIHRFTGLTLGVLLFLLALSGVLITFRSELLPLLYPEFRVTPGQSKLSVEDLLQKSQRSLHMARVSNYYNGESPDDASLVLYKDPSYSLPGIITIDPYTGTIQADMPLWKNLFAVALFFHANFFLGKSGEWLVGLLGLVLIFFVISGVILWWPKHGALIKLKRTVTKDQGVLSQRTHHLLGLAFALPLLLSAATGLLTVFDLGHSLGRLVLGESKRPEELSVLRTCNFKQDIKALSLLSAEVREKLISIHLCGPKNAYIKVSHGLTGKDYGRFLIDPASKIIVQRFDSTTDPISWNLKRLVFYPLHSGEILGLPGRILVLFGGLGLMGLFVSGIMLSLQRSRKRASTTIKGVSNENATFALNAHDT